MASSSKYDFEGLWFSTLLRVKELNDGLGEDRLDDSQLKEVTTSIFISKTQRGIVRPQTLSTFEQSVLDLLSSVDERGKQEQIYKILRSMIPNGSRHRSRN